MVNLSKEEAVKKINLRKEKVVSITKNISGVNARVALVMDVSGSMTSAFRSGLVQEVIERIIPIALTFDDNGELDFWVFNHGFKRCDPITMDNFYGITNSMINLVGGGTNYAPFMRDVDKKYVVEESMQIPNCVIVVTDGDNSDHSEAEKVIKSVSGHPIFWQFVGIGNASFQFLERFNTMKGRYVDNANFFAVNDIGYISDDELYGRLFAEFPQWLKMDKVQEIIRNQQKNKKKNFFGKLFGR